MSVMATAGETLRIYPAPQGEPASADYQVLVNSQPVFVYQAKVRQEIAKPPGSIWTHDVGCKAEVASLAYFDFEGVVQVAVTPARPFKSATVHPLSFGIEPAIDGQTIRFALDRPRKLTILLDGSDRQALHLFANAMETDAPKPGDPNVLYFGPGVHKVGSTRLKTGQQVYIAGGAVVRGQILPDEQPQLSKRTGLKHYSGATLHLDGVSNVRIRGRGILDGGDMPHAARSLILVANSKDVTVEGIILRDSPNWNVCIANSERVVARDLKLVSGRLNSDGINPVNSRKVEIRDCFIRNHDDSIAVKATRPEGECADILAEGCIIWNDWGYALGVTYETRAPIHDVTFRNCDVLTALFAPLGVYMVDSATVSNIAFEDIRVEATRDKLLRIAIGHDMWATDTKRGHIRSIRFTDVQFTGKGAPASEIKGFDAEHLVEDVTFTRLRIGGKAITSAAEGRFTLNAHTKGVQFSAE
ncbi:MAG TPA: glycosyl hydrolase family 28 protein [Planctomycetota bacterium]|nr:glycosyl hydrolase family 28 protein [Planctomycetota bacterium]HRR78723.1 glycosyl hydrolase family 28 protein [Planctomycetota bacterium]